MSQWHILCLTHYNSHGIRGASVSLTIKVSWVRGSVLIRITINRTDILYYIYSSIKRNLIQTFIVHCHNQWHKIQRCQGAGALSSGINTEIHIKLLGEVFFIYNIFGQKLLLQWHCWWIWKCPQRIYEREEQIRDRICSKA